jgi:hypothetical protein
MRAVFLAGVCDRIISALGKSWRVSDGLGLVSFSEESLSFYIL